MESEKRSIFKGIKLSESEWNQIKEAAATANRKDSDFMRFAILKYIEFIKQTK